jgi:hypothetical protein
LTDRILQFIFMAIAQSIVWIRPLVPIICLCLAWAFSGLVVWTLFSAIRSGVTNVREMHRIPCARCRYATRDYHLKCSVHPIEAFSEKAVDCPDFELSAAQALSESAY